jgi:hypothetical protein
VADFNLKKETLRKVGTYCEDGNVRYDMGWQKAAIKTYDALSGQVLMIGDHTEHVVCFQAYSESGGVCQRHKKKIEKYKTPDLPVCQHHCPKPMRRVAPRE